MNLNYENIKKLYDLNGLTESLILDILHTPSSIKDIREQNIGLRFGIWDEIAELINLSSKDMTLSEFDFDKVANIVNLTYFSPNLLEKYFSNAEKSIGFFNYSQISILFSREQNVKLILKKISNNEISNKKIYNTVFISLLLFSIQKYKLLKEKEEKNFLLRINNYSNENMCMNLFDLIAKRFVTLQKQEKYTRPLNKKKKIALLVNGQIRSLNNDHLHRMSDLFSSYEVDVFISTWLKKGGADIKKEQLYRFVENNIIDEVKSLTDMDIERLIEFRKSYYNEVTSEELFKAFNWANIVKINIEDESKDTFLNFDNHQKMYYHNNYWFDELDYDYFDNYDLIIKIRPDISFKKFDIEGVFSNLDTWSFLTEDKEGWIFRTWGFGVGDQIVIGSPFVMKELMSCYRDETITSLMKHHFKKEEYRGHINIGIAAWINSFKCVENHYLDIQFTSLPKLNKNDIENILGGE